MASTTQRTPRPSSRASSRSYTSCGRLAGMLPARISTSFSVRLSSFSSSWCRASSGMSGPAPFSSVSCPALILTLMRVMPFSRCTKSVCRPCAASPRSSQAPVSPATKPSATLGQPSWASTPDTLMPLPPSTQSSPQARFTCPTSSGASSRTT